MVPTDVADPDSVANLVAQAVDTFGRFDVADYADQGVRVNALAPGPILTDNLRRAGEQAQRGAAMAMPMRRVGDVDEVAAAAVWLCSDQASFITGSTLVIDGGKLAGAPPFQTGMGRKP